jgi:maltose alpha-D-glucosyltransferase/alpha-amylase
MLPAKEWLLRQRWFAGKSRRVRALDVYDQVPISDHPPVTMVLAEVAYESGPAELYSVPLLPDGADALESPDCQQLLLRLIAEGATRGPVRFEPLLDLPASVAGSTLLVAEQSNTSVRYGREWILKNFRKLAFGQSRDLEVGRFLTREAGFEHTPLVGGSITYDGRGLITLGVLQRFVENDGDGWTYVRSQLQPAPNAPDDVYWAQDGLPARDEALLDDVERLGRITGEMHRALSSRPDLPDFAPEPVSAADLAAWLGDLEAQRRAALAAASDAGMRELLGRRQAFQLDVPAITKIQIHGDYHLGQVLKTRDGFCIIDFEGEPARPLEERRAKQPALRDVAGMLRSLHYAAHSVSGDTGWADAWARQAGQRFVAGWEAASGTQTDWGLLELFLLAKAYYELAYELNNRPDWVTIPLHGVRSLLAEAGP